jgi:hypothetical protein
VSKETDMPDLMIISLPDGTTIKRGWNGDPRVVITVDEKRQAAYFKQFEDAIRDMPGFRDKSK